MHRVAIRPTELEFILCRIVLAAERRIPATPNTSQPVKTASIAPAMERQRGLHIAHPESLFLPSHISRRWRSASSIFSDETLC